MSRALLILAVVAGALVPAAPASAHGGDIPDSTSFGTRVSGVTPPLPGLSVSVIEAGARLELTNATGRTVEVLGYSGEPYLEVRPDGVFENVRSPAAYLNRTLDGTTPVPADADPTAPPQWRRVSGDSTARWHDQRTHWIGDGLPPAAAADPSSAHRIRSWSVPLRQEASLLSVQGTLDYLPPPRAWLWWVGAGLLALLVFRWPSWAGVVAGAGLLVYATFRTLDAAAPVPTFAVGLVGVLSFYWRRSPFLLTLGGAVVAIFGGLADVGVFQAAVAPVAGPSWIARVAVMVAIGAGLGTAAAGIMRLRKVSPGGAKVEA